MDKILNKAQSQSDQDKAIKVPELFKLIKSSAGPEPADIRVIGQVSQIHQSDSGHKYFLLGDGAIQIKCVFFADQSRNLDFKITNGWQMVVTGYVVTDKKTNQPQIIVDKVQPRGVSSMQLALTQLKERFTDGQTPEPEPVTSSPNPSQAPAGNGIPPLARPALNKQQPAKEMSSAEATAEKTGVARLSIISNSVLIVLKLAVGFVTGSVSVISEGIHSGMDLLAAIIAYYSVRAAAVPPDEEHKYGHGKIENLSGYIEATLIFLASILIVQEAVDKIINGALVEFLGLGVLVMGISVVLNWIVSKKLMFVAKKHHSTALEADAMHLTTDIYTSLGVMVGLILVELTAIQIIDPIVAILVALLIVYAAYELTKKSVRDLCDIKLTDQEEATIRRVLGEHNAEFVDYHQMRTRRASNICFIDFHLIVKKQSYIDAGHALRKRMEAALHRAFPASQILIQVEPCDENCALCPKKKDCRPD